MFSTIGPLRNRSLTLSLFLFLGGALGHAQSKVVLVQRTSRDAGTTTSAQLAFTSNNTVGNWIAVCVRAGNSTTQVFTASDSNGNTYHSPPHLAITTTPFPFPLF